MRTEPAGDAGALAEVPEQFIPADHRNVKARQGPKLGFKSLANAMITILGIELMRRIRKGPFAPSRLRVQGQAMPTIWNAVISA